MARMAALGASDELLERAAQGFTDEHEARAWLELMTPMYFPHFDPDVGERVFADVRMDITADQRGNELLASFDPLPRLGEITVPTLVIAGRDELPVPAPRPADSRCFRRQSRTPNSR